MQYLVAVAELRSFRRAAERCHVSQPSLSAQIAKAERALGVLVFERDRTRVRVTVTGESILERARAALLAADDLMLTASRLENPLWGTLRFGIIPTIAPYSLPAMAAALTRDFPRLSVVWREDRTAALVQAMAEGELDAAVLALEAPLGDLAQVPLAADPFLLCAPIDHQLGRSRSPLPLLALADVDMLVLDEGHCLRDQALAACASTAPREAGFRATSLPTLVQMVGAGAGVTLLPRLAVAVELPRAAVTVRRFRAPEPGRTIGLVHRPSSPLHAAIGEIGGTLGKVFAALARKANLAPAAKDAQS